MSDLQRFVDAQGPAFDTACAELAAGAKRSHWMWFVFPQLRALGRSATARHFGLDGLAEAKAYWADPVLGPRLKSCATLLLQLRGKSAREILGSPDDLKLRSCMTLFERAAPEEAVFGRVLERCCAGVRDDLTLKLLD